MAETPQDQPQPEFIEAELNYIIDDGVPPVMYVDWPEEEHKARPPVYESRTTKIENGRLRRGELNIREHGFVFVDHKSRVADFFDDAEVESTGYAETAELIKAETGATRVLVFDHTIRTADQSIGNEDNLRKPVKGVHNDYTERSAPQRLRDLLPADEAEAALKRRFAIIQIWRPIRAPVESEPLALCDGSTIPQSGFIRVERRYSHRTAEVYHIAYNPQHRWFYFPAMTPDEAIVFKVFDTDRDAGVPFTAHTAFDDPNSSADARPRESIEFRALAFF